jgi:glycosyltransferase involved in cell wall biosynthesis
MTTNESLISVIIPTYNRAHLINRAIRSVLNQTYPHFELIVVDDGSTDNTEEVVKGFQDSRIVYLRHDTNRGGSAARNTGIKAARGEYIAFQDSDDEWMPTKLEKQIELFKQDEKGDLGLVLCEVLKPWHGNIIQTVPKTNLMTYDNLLLHRSNVGYSTIQFMLKRSLVAAELYFDEELPASEEWDLLLRLTPLCRIDYVPEALARIYIDSDNRITNPGNDVKSRLRILQKYDAELKVRPKALRSCYVDLAVKYYYAGEAVKHARHYLRAAIMTYPLHPSAYIGLAFTLFGKWSFGLFVRLYAVIPGKVIRFMNIFKPGRKVKDT